MIAGLIVMGVVVVSVVVACWVIAARVRRPAGARSGVSRRQGRPVMWRYDRSTNRLVRTTDAG